MENKNGKLAVVMGLSLLFIATPPPGTAQTEFRGIASWYSQSDPGVRRQTANGEVFDDSKKTCASWGFSFGTRLKVTNTETGKSVICRVNDRGPAKRLNRLLDLSPSAFREIGKLKQGLIPVAITPLD